METNKPLGNTCWIVLDGYIPELTENDEGNQSGYLSHECACRLNTGLDVVGVYL